MNDASSRIDEPRSENPAFLRAVSELSRRRPIVVSRAIYNDNGMKLLEGGIAVDSSLYDRLLNHRLRTPLDECLDSDPSVTGRTLRSAAEALVYASPFFAQMAPVGRIRGMVMEAIQSIALPRPVAFQLTMMAEGRPDMFEHSVQAALLAAHLVREGGAPTHDIRVAATAGLLHDLGMLNIDPELLDPQRRLEGEERRPLYAHPLIASLLAGRFHVYPREVARAVLEHHERLDGSGYPRGVAGEAISPLGRVLSLVEVVTAMYDGHRRFPEQRVSLLLRLNMRRYDAALVPSIHRLLRAIPPPAETSEVEVDAAISRLQHLADLLQRWRESVVPLLADPAIERAAVLQSLVDQVEALQRVLYNAGVTREQLERLDTEDTRDAAIRIELWALDEEVRWHLRALGNQLQRRWSAEGLAGWPAPLREWLAQVRTVDKDGADRP